MISGYTISVLTIISKPGLLGAFALGTLAFAPVSLFGDVVGVDAGV